MNAGATKPANRVKSAGERNAVVGRSGLVCRRCGRRRLCAGQCGAIRLRLRADVPNADTRLWSGQFVTIKFVIGAQKDAVLVPYMAVQNGQQGPYVFVVTPTNTAALRQVTVGLRYDDLIAIESGVSPGERVVTIGQMGLAPGVGVTNVPVPAKR